jgi:hypothetical protein
MEEGLLIVCEIKRNRRLVRQSIARGRHLLDQGARKPEDRLDLLAIVTS